MLILFFFPEGNYFARFVDNIRHKSVILGISAKEFYHTSMKVSAKYTDYDQLSDHRPGGEKVGLGWGKGARAALPLTCAA